MLKIKTNIDGQVFISGHSTDLANLRYQIDEVIDHKMAFTKNYEDIKWNAWETKEASKTVTVSLNE